MNYDMIRRYVGNFKDFVGEGKDINSVNSLLWEEWFNNLNGYYCEGKYSWSNVKKMYSLPKKFLKWSYEHSFLKDLPRNIDSTDFKFRLPEDKEPPTFTNEEIRTLLAIADDRMRLNLLLMLNCGMTQKDVSDLRIDQCDLVVGRISRVRSKMIHQRGRMVSYKLWDETLELLKKYICQHGVLALRTATGVPWVEPKIKNDDSPVMRGDKMAASFGYLRRKNKFVGEGKSLKIFRKTSATRLGNSEYRDVAELFLGHKEQKVSGVHYIATEKGITDRLDRAVDWLHEQYGF